MSTTLGILTIKKALDEAASYLDKRSLNWMPENDMQKRLLRECNLLSDMPDIPTLKAWAKPTAEEINRILEEQGFDIRLTPWPPDGNTFGVVAINDFTVQWLVAGVAEESRGYKINIHDHPAFRLDHEAGWGFWQSPIHRDPVIRIPTKEGDMVYVTKYDQGPQLRGFGLLDTIRQIRDELRPVATHYEGIILPMVKLDQRPDISWIVGMWADANFLDVWMIAQALQQIKFGMNQFGARVKEATAIAVMRGGPSSYVVDQPFLMWIERDGILAPLFMAHITMDDWNDPGDLANL